jgi:fructose/tagatose bisphosphate aldolase
LPFEQNVELTRELVAFAHPEGVEVQAELGRLPDFGGEDDGDATDPDQAREFVAATGADFLAVSVGNVHLRTEGAAEIDWERLRAIRQQVDVPLVIHGGSGLSPETATVLIREGITLFHVGTVMKRRCWEAAQATVASRANQVAYQSLVGSRKPTDFLMPGKAAVTESVRSLMWLYGSSGKAV